MACAGRGLRLTLACTIFRIMVLQVADALSLQFRLPPPGVPPPLPRASPEVLGGCPAVVALLLTSVWAVAALRQLAQVRTAENVHSGLVLVVCLCSHMCRSSMCVGSGSSATSGTGAHSRLSAAVGVE
jgi:hypothetical protein